jgi:type VI secretion system protein ImpH
MPDLISRLLEQPEGFNLFQALHLLERAEPARRPVGTSLGVDEAVRLSAPVSLTFAASDIQAVTRGGGSGPGPAMTLSSPVMALAGAQGPLPVAYTETLLEGVRHRNPAGLAFLDIFQQRLLAFLHRGRRKHHIALCAGPLQDAPLMRVIDVVASLGRSEGARAPGGQAAWPLHAGLQGGAPRSMASLLAMLRDRLKLPFTGQSFVGTWLPLAHEERARLAVRDAGAPRLGRGAALGQRAWDPAAGIALGLAGLEPRRLDTLLPGGARNGLLAWLVTRHLQQDLRVHLQVDLAGVPGTRLRARPDTASELPARLGLSAWLTGPAGSPARPVQGPRFVLTPHARAHGH